MSQKSAPVFRKSVKGYKKEDVNAYIKGLSSYFTETERGYKKNLERASLDAEQLAAQLAEAKADNAAQAERIAALEGELENARIELDKIHQAVTAVSAPDSDDFGGITSETEKALIFDCISAKTGEIMLVACKTADEIVEKANQKATEILSDAKAKKENVLNSISDSADSVTSDISTYIKEAVNGCLEKIYASLKAADEESKK